MHRWTHSGFCFLVAVLGLVAAAPSAAQAPQSSARPAPTEDGPLESSSPAQRLRRGQNLFEFGDCAGATAVLESVAHPGILGDERQLLDVYRMLGICRFLGGQQTLAERRFEQMLYIDPEQSLDSFRTPPPVVEAFDRVKARIKAKLALIEAAKEREREKTAPPPATVLVERERVVETTPFVTIFLPFGLAQWANGEPGKALGVGLSQGLFLSANVASFWTLQGLKADGAKDPAEVDTHNVLQVTQAVALFGFVGLYLYGVGDAWWHHVAARTVSESESRRTIESGAAPRVDEALRTDVE